MSTTQLDMIVRKAEKILAQTWKSVYEDKHAELIQMFKDYGDRAYGVWMQDFMNLVVEPFHQEGLQVKANFNRHNSVENWGPPEERERCAWYLVHDEEGTPIGTLVLQVYHSHSSFFVPRAPQIFALQETDREDILSALSKSATRVRWDRKEDCTPLPAHTSSSATQWEYATDVSLGDCLVGTELEHSSWSLDEALSHWGRYGWELVSLMATGGKTIAYFKRPCLA
ncbi:hypothetical protein A8709_28830 [Paenibacillus pectinilyticus]|uniref:Uncharacterized protein n=1 Tax=Paenibacillus pectinilyticus TaxID=512399 RepID=A0A1C0ZUT5_9BACL|nr:DUF6022 family protein [Paenibacillus pectinilyticus]OCT11872.1 hypothetical protein A8709_28830 [Paenibacillus pectinilyticus]